MYHPPARRGSRSSTVPAWARTLGLLAVLAATTSAPALRAQAPQASPTAAAAVQLEGELEVQYEDSNTGARLVHYLRSGDTRMRLRFTGRPPDLLHGSRVRVRGTMRNGALELSGDGTTVQALTSVAPNTFGEQRTIVILVTHNGTTPYSAATAATTTFATTSDYFLENSYGQTWVTGDVFGWFPITLDTTQCNTDSIARQAEAAATAAGADLTRYTRRIYAFPSLSACGWWGLGTVGGNPSRSWINGSYALQVVGHEMGHNFGNYHSHSVPCDSTGCSTIEYGDSHDIMGNRSTGHMSPFQKERLGWLEYGRSPVMQVVSTSGAYAIDAYETGGTLPKALKILKGVDSAGRRTYYYVEARTRTGFDSSVAPGVVVRTGTETVADTSNQIDLAPTTTSFDQVLDPGQTFTDSSINLWLTTTSAGLAGATVDISYDGPACVPAAPTVTLSPGGTRTTAAGTPVTYTLGVTSNDGLSCPVAGFMPSASVPAGWTASFGSASVDVAAGGTASLAFTVTPAAGATGTFPVGATLTRTAAGPGGSASTNLNVAAALDVGLSIASGSQYTFSATVRAAALPVSGATVTFAVRSPTGATTTLTATTGSNGTATARMRLRNRDPRGTYSVVATATANGLTGSATGSFTR